MYLTYFFYICILFMIHSFEEVKLVTSIIHYTVFISTFVFLCYYRTKTVFHFFYKFYILISFWALICYLANGCPLTHIENLYAISKYGVPFYPEYSFNQSNIYSIISWGPLYIPLFVVLFIKITEHFTDNDTDI